MKGIVFAIGIVTGLLFSPSLWACTSTITYSDGSWACVETPDQTPRSNADPNDSWGAVAVNWEKKVGVVASNYQSLYMGDETEEACSEATGGAKCDIDYKSHATGLQPQLCQTVFLIFGTSKTPSLYSVEGRALNLIKRKEQEWMKICNTGGDTCTPLLSYCNSYGNHSNQLKKFDFSLPPDVDAKYDAYMSGRTASVRPAPTSASFLAFSLSKKDRKFGGGSGKTEAAARSQAQKKCGKTDCQVIAVTSSNSCLAAAWGRTGTGENYDFATGGKTEVEARQAALQDCKKNTGNQCQIYYAQCLTKK